MCARGAGTSCVAGHTSTHNFQILAAGGCIDRCDVAYAVGLKARGLSKVGRRLFEAGALQVTEWTNAALAWRYRAAAMGIPFIPARVMLGTDTFAKSAAVVITCRFTGIPLVALPALYPDVALIHVHRADAYGNCQIDGITVADEDLARAAKRVIITCERLVLTDDIRAHPDRTRIPWYLVDAVIEVPFGGYPGNVVGGISRTRSTFGRGWRPTPTTHPSPRSSIATSVPRPTSASTSTFAAASRGFRRFEPRS